MLVLDRQTTAGSPGSASLEGVRLRLAPSGQVIELPRGKTTIGSSPRCYVRIQEPGVQPLHCLILNAGQELTVRRWAGETSLNGRRLDESPLAVGDRLQVGPVELEVVGPVVSEQAVARNRSATSAVQPATGAPRTIATPAQPLAGKTNSVASATGELHDMSQELAAARKRVKEQEAAIVAYQPLAIQTKQLARKSEELEAQIAEMQGQLETARLAAISLSEKEASHSVEFQLAESENARLMQCRDELTSQNTALHSERDALRRQVDQLQADLQGADGEKSSLNANLQTLAGEKAQLESERRELNEKLTNLYAELERAASENARLTLSLEEYSQRCSTLGGKRDELHRRADELQRNLQWVTGEKSAVENERNELRRQVDELQLSLQSVNSDTSNLASERHAFAEQVGTMTAEREQLAAENAQLRQLADELRNQTGELQGRVQSLADNKTALDAAHQELLADHRNLRERSERLDRELQASISERATTAEEYAVLSNECERIRSERINVANLEQQVRAAVADRDSTSSELYRALLQLAEMRECDDDQALGEAHRALAAELEKSTSEVAELTEQIERLTEQHAAAEAARIELAKQQTATAEVQVRFANEKCALEETAADLRGELMEACEREAQYVAQLRSADEWRQKYEAAARNEAALAESTAELEARLAGKLQSDDEAAKLADEREQKVAEFERLLAAANESVGQLQQQLADTVETRSNVELSRDLWENERAGWEQQQSALREQIAKLEAQLSESLEAPSVEHSRAVVETLPPNEHAAAYDWTADSDKAPQDSNWTVAGDADSDPFAASGATESPPETFSWGQPAAEREFASEPQVAPSSESGVQWETPAVADDAEFGSMMNWSTEPAELPSSDSPLNSQVEDEIEAPASLLTSRSGPFDKVVATDRAPVQEEAPAPQSTSFIDRYSHMFVDDKPPVDAPAAPTLRSTDGEDHRQQPRNSGVANGNVGTPLTGDEEESIEQYMSKLLQRVRGDGPAPAAASQAPPAAQPPISGPLGYEPTPMQDRNPMTLSAISLRDSLTADGATPTDGPRRKSSIPAPQTDLEALRALANESARRAISRHSLRKYRRNATTKVIVSTLAAMTSVWLMIESPDLLHWQFLGACGTMVIAAYWTGQTIRALLETLRVTAPDDTEKEIREISAELQARLPIDVVSTDK